MMISQRLATGGGGGGGGLHINLEFGLYIFLA